MSEPTEADAPKLSRKDIKRKLEYAAKDFVNGRALVMQCCEAFVGHPSENAARLFALVECIETVEAMLKAIDEVI